MYNLLLFILLAAGAVPLISGLANMKKGRIAVGIAILVLSIGFFALLSFWSEMLWFSALGYSGRFWTAVFAYVGTAAVGAVFAGLAVFLLTWPIPSKPPLARAWPEVLGVLLGAFWGARNWELVLKYLNGVTTEIRDPILGRDAGFYLFSLPFYDALYWLLLGIATVAVLAGGIYLATPRRREEGQAAWRDTLSDRNYGDFYGLYVGLGVFLLVVGWGNYLNRFHLMYSPLGAVSGPGWTDVTIRFPAYWLVAAACVVAGVVLLIPPLSRRMHAWTSFAEDGVPGAAAVGIPIAAVVGIWFLALFVAPGLTQWLVVEPNEISMEKPYIKHNIEFTRRGFGLDAVEKRKFPASAEFNRQIAEKHQDVLSQVRLWDPRALIQVYKQFQEIRLYYVFPDVDIDRYTIDGKYRQVMVSPREMQLDHLPKKSRTFVNRHFKYTHGYGLTLAPVNEFTSNGLPDLFVKDIPPKSRFASLEVENPRIYYGELTDDYVVGNSKEEEFDYPRGEENVYNRYDGKGGVELSNLWRRFVFGWSLGGTRFFLSSYPTEKSRVLFRRNVAKRVKALAPFLKLDQDPYIVLSGGKLYWILDTYTTSRNYPYSEPFESMSEVGRPSDAATMEARPEDYLYGANYVRNAVKVVVDAYEGTVDLYVFDPDDPIIRVWRRIFPTLFRDKKEMPSDLLAHIRYPEGLLLAQGLVYAKYHMTDPAVFYNQEDLWVRATEKYYGSVQPVEPYYIMWQPPETDRTEFVQILPFTPKNRQVLIGWIAGMCDPENYGRVLSYRFPKEKRVLGPQQVETKIDQDSYLSGQLSLWDQRGSNVIRGNVLAIPIGETLLYVEPIYLQADAAAYPELRLVALMHEDTLSYAETFEKALEGLYGERKPTQEPAPGKASPPTDESFAKLAQQAGEAFDEYLKAHGERRFDDAAGAIERLSETLSELQERTSDVSPPPEEKPPQEPRP